MVFETQYTGLFLQNILLYPSLYSIHKTIQRIEPMHTLPYYRESISYALQQSKRIALIFFGLSCLTAVSISNTMNGSDSQIATNVFFVLLVIIPNSIILTGIFGYLMMEQRLAYHSMQWTLSKIVDQSLTDEDYRNIRQSINIRSRYQHINWLICGGIVGLVVTFVLLLAISYSPALPPVERCSIIFVTLANYGREIVVLLLFLWEIGIVNDIYRQMLRCVSQINTVGEGKDVMRLKLYVAMKELPMGTTVLYFRPSKRDIFIQMASSMFAMFIALLKAFVHA